MLVPDTARVISPPLAAGPCKFFRKKGTVFFSIHRPIDIFIVIHKRGFIHRRFAFTRITKLDPRGAEAQLAYLGGTGIHRPLSVCSRRNLRNNLDKSPISERWREFQD